MKRVFNKLRGDRSTESPNRGDASEHPSRGDTSRHEDILRFQAQQQQDLATVKPSETWQYTLEKKAITGKLGTNACVVHAVEMVLERDPADKTSRREIKQGISYTKENGATLRDAARYLGESYLHVFGAPITEDSLRTMTSRGPCILEYGKNSMSHAVVADAMDENGYVSIRDSNPAVGAVIYHFNEVAQRWNGNAVATVAEGTAIYRVINELRIQNFEE